MKQLLWMMLMWTFAGCSFLGMETRNEPLRDARGAFDVPTESSVDLVNIVQRAAWNNGWSAFQIGPETVRCEKWGFCWTMTVDVCCAGLTYTVEYVDSKFMAFNRAKGEIHPGYNRQVGNLKSKIAEEMRRVGGRTIPWSPQPTRPVVRPQVSNARLGPSIESNDYDDATHNGRLVVRIPLGQDANAMAFVQNYLEGLAKEKLKTVWPGAGTHFTTKGEQTLPDERRGDGSRLRAIEYHIGND